MLTILIAIGIPFLIVVYFDAQVRRLNRRYRGRK